MAALTAASTKRYNTGDTNEIEVRFTTVDDGDTYALTGLKGYISHVAFATNNPSTQASAGIHVAHSSGTFTFYPGENAAAVTLRIRTRS